MAAAGSVERLYKVTVDGTEAVRQLQNIAAATAATDEKLAKFTETVTENGKQLLEALGAREIVDHLKELINTMDELGKSAERFGVGVDNLQRLQFAAQATGSSADQMNQGLARLSKGMLEMSDATNATGQALRALGVTSRDDTETAMLKLADAFAKLPDGAQKTALAMEIFGKEVGPSLIPMLNQGREGMQAMARDAEELGLVLDSSATKSAAEFNDQLQRMGNITKGELMQALTGALPELRAIAQTWLDSSARGKDFAAIGRDIADVLDTLAKGAILVNGGFQKLFGTIAMAKDLSPFKAIFHPQETQEIIKQINGWWDDVDQRMADSLEKLQNYRTKYQQEAATPLVGPPAPDPGQAAAEALAQRLEALRNAQKELADTQRYLTESIKEFDAAAKVSLEDWLKQQKAVAKVMDDLVASTEDAKQAQLALDTVRSMGIQQQTEAEKRANDVRSKTIDGLVAYTNSLGDTATEVQVYMEILDDLAGKYDEVSNAQRKYAQDQIAKLQNPEAAKALEIQKQLVDQLASAWDSFVGALATGTTSAAAAFRQFAQSLITDLLRIWSQKYILDALTAMFGGGAGADNPALAARPGGHALGDAFSGGRIVPMMAGGIIHGPVRVPMALMGEAGPEAVMPLQRTSTGALGVAAVGGGGWNVAIHNYTGAQVSARRDGAGDLQVIIQETRKAIASDFKRGGNDVARAAESAYRLSRGAASPF